jgi:hypothetical protein
MAARQLSVHQGFRPGFLFRTVLFVFNVSPEPFGATLIITFLDSSLLAGQVGLFPQALKLGLLR